MIKKYICILNWSRFFIIFMLICIANIMLGLMLPMHNRDGVGWTILFCYVILIVNSLIGYDRFYRSQVGLKILETTPIKIENVMKLYKYTKLIMLFLPAIIGTFILLVKHNKMGWFIIPNSIILLVINYFANRGMERKEIKEDEVPVVVFFLSEVTMGVIYGIEFFFLLAVF